MRTSRHMWPVHDLHPFRSSRFTSPSTTLHRRIHQYGTWRYVDTSRIVKRAYAMQILSSDRLYRKSLFIIHPSRKSCRSCPSKQNRNLCRLLLIYNMSHYRQSPVAARTVGTIELIARLLERWTLLAETQDDPTSKAHERDIFGGYADAEKRRMNAACRLATG